MPRGYVEHDVRVQVYEVFDFERGYGTARDPMVKVSYGRNGEFWLMESEVVVNRAIADDLRPRKRKPLVMSVLGQPRLLSVDAFSRIRSRQGGEDRDERWLKVLEDMRLYLATSPNPTEEDGSDG